MFRVIDVRADGTPEVVSSLDAVAPPPEGVLRWIDLVDGDDAAFALLGARFGFHPLALEDCAHEDQRPKIEEYGGYSFIVTQGFECPGPRVDDLKWHELHAFLGPNYLVTVHTGDIPGLEQVWTRVASDPVPLRRGVDFAYYLLVDRMVDNNFPILDQIADELEEIENTVLTHPRAESLTQIFSLKRHLVTMRKVLSPQRDVLSLLSKRADNRVSDKTSLYFRDVYDHLARIVESIEGNRDLLGNALDAYLSATSQRTNEIMKTLAILSAVFMPLTFITGFFGQNFEGLPYASNVLMWAMLASVVLSPLGLLLWFKSRRWF